MKQDKKTIAKQQEVIVSAIPWDNIASVINPNFVHQNKISLRTIRFMAKKDNYPFVFEATFKGLKQTNPEDVSLERAMQITQSLQDWAQDLIESTKKVEKELDDALKKALKKA